MNSNPTLTKIELSKYSLTDVMDIARSVQSDIRDHILQGQQLQVRLAQLKFRDMQGYYWTVEPRTLTWYVYAQGMWNPAPPPQGTFEGLAHQALAPVPIRKPIANEGDEAHAAQPDHDPTATLAGNIQETRQAYEQRQITSTAAEGLTSLFYLVDKNTRLWTVGFHSGQWYYFDAGRWNRASQPLDASQLSDQSYGPRVCPSCGKPAGNKDDVCPSCGTRLPARSEQAMEQARAKLVELVKSGLMIPEPVAAPFSPPPDPAWQAAPTPTYAPGTVPMPMPMPAPAPVAQMGSFCTRCGRPIPPGASFCGACGYPIGGTTHV
jgi:hypothetical protein